MGVQQQIEGYQYAQEEIKQSPYEAEYGPAGYFGVILGGAGEILASFLSPGIYHARGVLAELQAALSNHAVRPFSDAVQILGDAAGQIG